MEKDTNIPHSAGPDKGMKLMPGSSVIFGKKYGDFYYNERYNNEFYAIDPVSSIYFNILFPNFDDD